MDRILFEASRIDVVDRDGYIFTHTRNAVVYLLPYRLPKEGVYLLGRFEICPAHHSKHDLYAITGQCEPSADPLDIAVMELHEEWCFVADPSRFTSLEFGYLTKQADTIAHFFMADVTDLRRGSAPSDGSRSEQEVIATGLRARKPLGEVRRATGSYCAGWPMKTNIWRSGLCQSETRRNSQKCLRACRLVLARSNGKPIRWSAGPPGRSMQNSLLAWLCSRWRPIRLLREALTSLYNIFPTTRQILKEAGPDVGGSQDSVGGVVIEVLNRGLRPFLSRWHPRLQAWEARRASDRSPQEHEWDWPEAEQNARRIGRSEA